MADQVQASLDQMVAPLKDLLDRGIFSQEEIRSIVARRRESEYLLRRRAARKADFLGYIETEMALEKLRVIRTRQVEVRLKQQQQQQQQQQQDDKNNSRPKKKDKQHIGDYHIIQHVHLLFVRATRKFKSDVTLYLQHAAFCKQVKSFSQLTRIYSEAVQIHPKHVGLWIEAASHEFFGVDNDDENDDQGRRRQKDKVVHGGGSVQNARIILQRGLRINPHSHDLWLQAFGLELHYIQKLRGRAAIMNAGHNDETTANPSQQQHQQPTSMSLPLLVFKNAVRAIPDDLTFRLKFVDLCQMFPKDSVDIVQQHILNTIRDDFDSIPSAWIAWAAHVAARAQMKSNDDNNDNASIGFMGTTEPNQSERTNNDDDNDDMQPRQKRPRSNSSVDIQNGDMKESSSNDKDEDPVLNVLAEAMDKVPSSEMYLLSAQFAQNYAESLAAKTESKHDVEASQLAIQAVNEFIAQLFVRAERLGIQTSELVLEQVNYILLHSSDEQGDAAAAAMAVLESFCNNQHKDSTNFVPSNLWIRWADLQIMSHSASDGIHCDDDDDASSRVEVISDAALHVLRKGLDRTPMTESSHHMILLAHMIMGLISMITHTLQEGQPTEEEPLTSYQNELDRLLQQLFILAPGVEHTNSKPFDDVEYSKFFGVCSIPRICLQYLRLQKQRHLGTDAARNFFHRFFFQHKLPLTNWVVRDANGWKDFMDECIVVEFSEHQKLQHKTALDTKKKNYRQRLDRLFQLAMTLFRETPFGDDYKRERENRLAKSI